MRNLFQHQQKDVTFAIALKTTQIQRDCNVNVEEYQILDTLLFTRWKDGIPVVLNEILADIFSLEVKEIVSYLSTKIITEAPQYKLEELKDLIGGNYE